MAEPLPHFGIKWPQGYDSLVLRHNYCALHNVGRGSFYHRKELIKIFWPGYQWHAWSERRLQSICDKKWVTWMGPGASGKSTDAAIFALQRFLEAPQRTAIAVCSTTMKMLRKRIWSELSRWHQALPRGLGSVGELIDSDTMIRWKRGDTKHGIYGMAVEEGPIEEVLNNLIGMHAERVWLILDEMQGVREAIISATNNMSKNAEFWFLGMGNPEGDDPLTRESEPLGGWESVERGVTETWSTLGGPINEDGRCDFFNGRLSPAIVEPDGEKKYFYLINQRQIDGHLKRVAGNEMDPSFQSQCIGWPPMLGVESTVLDAAICQKFKCQEKAIWTHGFQQGWSLDPAFGGGDRKILQFFRFGEVAEEAAERAGVWDAVIAPTKKRWVIEMNEWLDVPIDTQAREPVHYQIFNYVKKACELKGMKFDDGGLDASGEGGGLKAIFDKEWGPIIGVEFGGAPSERFVEEGSQKTAKEEYDTRSSELNMTVRRFAMANGLRGISNEAKEQFCARKTFYRNKKTRVEPKSRRSKGQDKGFKDRLGYSPDHADAVAIACEIAMQRGAVPVAIGPAADFDPMQKIAADGGNFYAAEEYASDYDFSYNE